MVRARGAWLSTARIRAGFARDARGHECALDELGQGAHARFLRRAHPQELLDCIVFLGFHRGGEAPYERAVERVFARHLIGVRARADQRLDL